MARWKWFDHDRRVQFEALLRAGHSKREIAQLLELPLATVLSKSRRALKKLNLLLEGDDA